MKRSLALLLAIALAGGCHNSSQAVDPFLPRTTVPPPGTGAAVGGAPAPYYPGAAGSTVTPAAPSNSYSPPGGSYNYPSAAPATLPSTPPGPRATDHMPMTRRDEDDKHSSVSPAERAPAAVRSRVATANRGAKSEIKLTSAEADAVHPSQPAKASSEVKIVRVISPASGKAGSDAVAASDARPADEPRRLSSTDDAIDIMDLPPARSRGAQQAASRRIMLASHQEPADDEPTPVEDAAAPEEAGRYAYASDYGWLKGQLEYSLVDQRWKLRYIPIDGNTDSHGGSVVLDGAVPAEFQAGDFVVVRGSLSGDAAAGRFAPKYRFDSISPLAD